MSAQTDFTPKTQCGEYAASFIPRLGQFFCCVLPKGHEGEHRAGGECFAHGKYVMEHSGEYPTCPHPIEECAKGARPMQEVS